MKDNITMCCAYSLGAVHSCNKSKIEQRDPTTPSGYFQP